MQNVVKNGGDRSIPRHVAVIMDGNGRWAEAQGKPRIFGHRCGAEAVRRTVEAAAQRGIEFLTLFAFSSENWKRPKIEVAALMRLFSESLKREAPRLKANNIKTVIVGDTSRFSETLQKEIDEVQALTVDCTGMELRIAANYGGRWDIAMVAKALALKSAMGLMDPSSIDEQTISSYLSVPENVDLLIRTGGEKRISNFLLWQVAYAEIYFSDVLWPDFDDAELAKGIEFFKSRERRFGMISEQLRDNYNAD